MKISRRSFFKVLGGLSASIALPMQSIVSILPKDFAISAVSWTKAYDLYSDCWIFRANCWIGRKVEETTDRISLENPIQLGVDLRSSTEELDESSKEPALLVLKQAAEFELEKLLDVI